jgi:hypothetical protein
MAQPTPQDFSFGNRTGKALYEELAVNREQVIQKARDLARISLPSEFPPEGYRPGDNLKPPNQSINARGLVNLSSRIMLTALPPGLPILKYNIIEHRLRKDFEADPKLYAMTLLALARREVAIRQRMEDTTTRTAYGELDMQLLLAGNALWRHITINSPSVHKMTDYVVKRNSVGEQLKVILKLTISLSDVDLETRGFIENVRQSLAKRDTTSDEVVIECCQKVHRVSKTERVWLYWEEYEGELIPGTDVQTAYDAPPLYAAWLKPNYGFDWGTSYCQLYEGDMYIVENDNGSLNDASEAAALTWLFVRPGGVTSKRVLEKAENLKIMHGDAADITTFRLEKGSDFNFVVSKTERAERRLGQAFLLVSAIQRQGERVTKEEWVQMVGELNQAMGGLYATFAQGPGKAVITRFIALAEDEDDELVPLPKGVIRIAPITGLDAMAIDEEARNLEEALTVAREVLGDLVAEKIDLDEALLRILAGRRVRPDGLVLGLEQQASNKQQAMQEQAGMTMLDKAAGPIAKEGAAALSEVLTPQLAQQLQAATEGQQ